MTDTTDRDLRPVVTLRWDYMGKRLPMSREAAISMGRTAKREGLFSNVSARTA